MTDVCFPIRYSPKSVPSSHFQYILVWGRPKSETVKRPANLNLRNCSWTKGWHVAFGFICMKSIHLYSAWSQPKQLPVFFHTDPLADAVHERIDWISLFTCSVSCVGMTDNFPFTLSDASLMTASFADASLAFRGQHGTHWEQTHHQLCLISVCTIFP